MSQLFTSGSQNIGVSSHSENDINSAQRTHKIIILYDFIIIKFIFYNDKSLLLFLNSTEYYNQSQRFNRLEKLFSTQMIKQYP